MALGVDLDVHGISEAVTGMVTDRNLEDPPARVNIAPKDTQARAAPGNLELFGHCCRSGYGLDVLEHSRDRYAGMLLKLLEKRLGRWLDLLGRLSQIRVNVGVRDRNRQAISDRGTYPLEVKPGLRASKANLFCVFLRQLQQSGRLKENVRVRGVLKDLFHVRQRLMQCTSPGSRRLNQRSGSTATLNESFRLKHPQRFPHGESTDSVACAKNRFGRKLAIPCEFAAEYFFAKDLGEFLVSRLLVGITRSFRQQLRKLSLDTK